MDYHTVQHIKPQVVYNSFLKCGFPDKDSISTSTDPQDNEAEEELSHLLDVFEMSHSDFWV